MAEGVEADRDALQPGVLERLRLAREQRAVRCQRQVERPAIGRLLNKRGEHKT